jgi:hypothetical protein
MFLRHLFTGLGLCAVLFVTGCHCGACRREVVGAAPIAPACNGCGGAPGAPGAVVPPPPAPVGAFATPTTGTYAVPR